MGAGPREGAVPRAPARRVGLGRVDRLHDRPRPPARGALALVALARRARGIIPADAGSTSRRRSSEHVARDHPRGCGEHAAYDTNGQGGEGSSPQMRGPQDRLGQQRRHGGIIPADTGSTRWRRWRSTGPWDHPRGCGEHVKLLPLRPRGAGSSPRMRGAPVAVHADALDVGIIPADAGSTCLRLSSRRSPGDYPRGCGEHPRCAWAGPSVRRWTGIITQRSTITKQATMRRMPAPA